MLLVSESGAANEAVVFSLSAKECVWMPEAHLHLHPLSRLRQHYVVLSFLS